MENYSDKADGNKVFELEDESTTIEESRTPIATASVDEILYQKFLDFPDPKVALARTGIK